MEGLGPVYLPAAAPSSPVCIRQKPYELSGEPGSCFLSFLLSSWGFLAPVTSLLGFAAQAPGDPRALVLGSLREPAERPRLVRPQVNTVLGSTAGASSTAASGPRGKCRGGRGRLPS